MRKIKFRAWYEKDKQFVHFSGIFNQQPVVSETFEIKGTSFITTKSYGSPIIEQFTGLCDKNGKEIYEHDIVDNGQTVVYSNGETRRFYSMGVVSFDVKNGCIVINNNDGYNKRLTQKNIKQLNIEVIGNVHENNTKEKAND